MGFRVPVAKMLKPDELARALRIPAPAIDVLSEVFDPVEVEGRLLAHSDEEIGDVLLHQEVMAGVGNVFKSEICLQRTCSRIQATRLSRMAAASGAPRMRPIQPRACGFMDAMESHAAAAVSAFAGVSRGRTRALLSGARAASPCQTARRLMDRFLAG